MSILKELTVGYEVSKLKTVEELEIEVNTELNSINWNKHITHNALNQLTKIWIIDNNLIFPAIFREFNRDTNFCSILKFNNGQWFATEVHINNIQLRKVNISPLIMKYREIFFTKVWNIDE